MSPLVIAAQLIIALSIVVVWVFRFDNIVTEFKQYGLPDLVRTMVGAAKIALATLLIVGIWYPDVVVASALAMAFLMLCAQVAHIKVRNPWHKYVPSFVLLLLSLFVAGAYAGVISV
ncbi:DoxX family protein [Hymenobacter sp. BT188]|uniref:DoxX family protein n=1 Tax=Hymenobacter sp. BT188 TaxID=2763504 RepID=UPI001651AC3E|nr:DoxX family protein [Hymenobacter sp. BT188]MBC6606870.1 DoxX family protein [Hymenobacter sp. BT188]